MRIISQNGNCDFEYGAIGIVISKEYIHAVAHGTSERYLLARYESEEESKEAMAEMWDFFAEEKGKFYQFPQKESSCR